MPLVSLRHIHTVMASVRSVGCKAGERTDLCVKGSRTTVEVYESESTWQGHTYTPDLQARNYFKKLDMAYVLIANVLLH